VALKAFSNLVLGVAAQPVVETFASRSPLTRGLVARFVAGETLDQALAAVRALQERGLHVTLDHLGENTTSIEDADAACAEALHALEGVRFAGLDAHISVKLTQLGLDVGEHVVRANAERLLERARTLHSFVRIDMEGSLYTARTLELFSALRRRYENVGIVLQASLYRSMADARALTAEGARIRLVKGAYSEPAHISYRRKRDTDRNYLRIMEFLLREGHFPAIATHDVALIDHACAFAREYRIAADRFEFQLLYGVRRDLQESLVRQGHGVRVYVPYGAQWYPYLTRRLAERPANLLFMLGSVVRERVRSTS
jgi:proline dehydrogenase